MVCTSDEHVIWCVLPICVNLLCLCGLSGNLTGPEWAGYGRIRELSVLDLPFLGSVPMPRHYAIGTIAGSVVR